MRNKEHIAATNRLCQINDLGPPRNTIVGNYCPFLGRVWNGNYIDKWAEFLGLSKWYDWVGFEDVPLDYLNSV